MITNASANTPTASRRLDALAVEAALNGRRRHAELPLLEIVEVVRIARRRGDTLEQLAELLEVDARALVGMYAAAGPR